MSFLASDELLTIHQAALNILERTGMRFNHPEVIAVLKDHGIRVEADRAYFRPEQVMEALGRAPRRFRLQAPNPAHDLEFGLGRQYLVPGLGSSMVVESNGEFRQATFKDFCTLTRMCQAVPEFAMLGPGLVVPTDVDPTRGVSLSCFASLALSDKTLSIMACSAQEARRVHRLMELAMGPRMSQGPVVMGAINTLSPLQMDHFALDCMLTHLRAGQAICVSPATMAGTTGPMTLAGTCALSHAEAMAGLVVCQLVRSGAPVIYGFQSTTSDARSGAVAIGSPEQAMAVQVGGDLARYLGLPSRGGGTLSDAAFLSVQCGYESMLTMIATRRARTELVVHGAGILGGYAGISPDKMVVDLEMWSMLEHMDKGMTVTPETLAMEVIQEVGPGRNFITHAHTLKHCRTASWLPNIGLRGHLTGLASHQKLMERVARKRQGLMDAYQRPAGTPELTEAMSALLRQEGMTEIPPLA